MLSYSHIGRLLAGLLLLLCAAGASAQSFRVQCPTNTTLHPLVPPTFDNPTGANPNIKCQQISGGDGFVTMGDGTQTYLFGFGPLSGLLDMAKGLPGTQPASVFNLDSTYHLPSIFIGAPVDQGTGSIVPGYDFNSAVGLVVEQDSKAIQSVTFNTAASRGTGYHVGDIVVFSGGGAVQDATGHVASLLVTPVGRINTIVIDNGGSGYISAPTVTVTRSSGTGTNAVPTANLSNTDTLTGHIDPRLVMDVGVMNANQPAPLMAIDEDDEFFLTLTNVGQVMRPDLFEQHTVHFHGYPNASAFYDGVPDASIAINIGGSFTYYYLAPDAGTYFWHCHISPPEHLQMGMVGQLYVRPRQNRVAVGDSLYTALSAYEAPVTLTATSPASAYEPVRKRCGTDILCSTPLPPSNSATRAATGMYAYNDGDGSTYYDVEYPIQMMGFDPNFHFVGMTFNPESFADMKDKFFLLNGRSYPDTINPDLMTTQSTDGTLHASQPLPSLINIPAGGRALLRISDLNVTEYHTLASLGIPMKVIAVNARILRDMAGVDMSYTTNSITLAGGESLDVILDACQVRANDGTCTTAGYAPGQTFYLYTPQLDHLSNDAENFGGMMTEIRIIAAN